MNILAVMQHDNQNRHTMQASLPSDGKEFGRANPTHETIVVWVKSILSGADFWVSFTVNRRLSSAVEHRFRKAGVPSSNLGGGFDVTPFADRTATRLH
jgi:hypothetical protein